MVQEDLTFMRSALRLDSMMVWIGMIIFEYVITLKTSRNHFTLMVIKIRKKPYLKSLNLEMSSESLILFKFMKDIWCAWCPAGTLVSTQSISSSLVVFDRSVVLPSKECTARASKHDNVVCTVTTSLVIEKAKLIDSTHNNLLVNVRSVATTHPRVIPEELRPTGTRQRIHSLHERLISSWALDRFMESEMKRKRLPDPSMSY